MPRHLSVIILTFNEEANLPACLGSIAELDADIFVVDSGSTDRTFEIARAGGAQVVSHPFEDYARQRNWALVELHLNTPWVLNLDADERLTPELAQEIQGVLEHPPSGVQGFLLCKRTIFLGRWIRHGGHYPSYHLRLFRQGAGRCEARLYDQHFLVDGPVVSLRNDYIDILTSDLATWSQRHLRWSEAEAREILRLGDPGDQVRPRFFGSPIERKRWLRNAAYGRAPIFTRAFAYWLYRYFFRLGFLDGTEGLIFHFLQGLWFRFMVDAYVYSARRREGS